MNISTISDRKLLLILLAIVIALFAHNIYLQIQIDKAIDYASDAEWQAREAKDFAEDAARNAFANNCRSCP